jgi:hypothetical protein
LHREDAPPTGRRSIEDAKKGKSKRVDAVFRNKIGFSSFFSSSLRSRRFVALSGVRLRGAKFESFIASFAILRFFLNTQYPFIILA